LEAGVKNRLITIWFWLFAGSVAACAALLLLRTLGLLN
jgi:hypothetical protein